MNRAISVAVLAAAIFSTACGAKTINQVLADPGKYRNKQVTIRGAVVDSFSVIGRGAYRVDDMTGTLWVVSNEGVPRQGTRVQVKGRVQEGFSLGPLGTRLPAGVGSGVVMLESSHKAQ